MGSHAQLGSELGNGQAARKAAWVGLAGFEEDAMFQADGLHGTGQDRLQMLWGDMTKFGQMPGNIFVRLSLLTEFENGGFDLVGGRETFEGAHSNRDNGGSRFSPFPDDAGLDLVRREVVNDHLVDQTA